MSAQQENMKSSSYIPNESTQDAQDVDIDFVTLGMFIIDEIHYQPPKPPVTDILGGAGTYAALGARIVSPPPLSKSVGWIVDAGNDFPNELRTELSSWQTSCLIRETPWRNTTRGWNGYGANEERAFKYLTPKLRLDESSLDNKLLRSKVFHLICSPLRCIDLITKVEAKRDEIYLDHCLPLWVWEPVPDLCVPEELENCRKALELVDVFSPNHIELCNFFGKSAIDSNGETDQKLIFDLCRAILPDKNRRKPINFGQASYCSGQAVIRAGKDGCLVYTNEAFDWAWAPPYHTDPTKVVDPTGGGNAFVGAMATVLARKAWASASQPGDLYEAAFAGSVAASFAIEQVGMPKLEQSATGEETWNGEAPSKRLEYYESIRKHMHSLNFTRGREQQTWRAIQSSR